MCSPAYPSDSSLHNRHTTQKDKEICRGEDGLVGQDSGSDGGVWVLRTILFWRILNQVVAAGPKTAEEIQELTRIHESELEVHVCYHRRTAPFSLFEQNCASPHRLSQQLAAP
jgi:hypothetical protein